MITYRELKKEEVAGVMLALDSAYKTPLSQELEHYSEYVIKLASLACNYGAFDGDKPVGHIAFYKNDYESKISFISQIVVDSSVRGQGLGYNLMECCKKASMKDGFKGIRLEVSKKNLTAEKFYFKYGFKIECERDKSFFMIYNFSDCEKIND